MSRVNVSVASLRWISLRAALEHIVLYRHSSKLAETALRDALAAGRIASRARIFCSTAYRRISSGIELKISKPPSEPVVELDYELDASLWLRLSVNWADSSASQQQEMEPTEYGVWEESGKRFVRAAKWHPSIEMSGIVISELQLFNIWPSVDARVSPTAKANPQAVKRGRTAGTDLRVLDGPHVAEMRRLIKTARASSISDAAKIVVRDGSHIAGGGTIASKVARLVKRYKENN